MSFNDRCGDAAEVMAHGGVLGEAAREALVELLRESKETCAAPRDLVMGILDDPANRALRSRTSDGEWREDLGGDSAPCLRILCPDALNGRPHWHTRPADAASPAADEPMSTPDSGGLPQRGEVWKWAWLTVTIVKAGPKRVTYDTSDDRISSPTDRFLTRFHRTRLAAHPEPVPTPDSADDATVGELVHWIGEHRNTLHGNGAGSKGMERVSGDEDEVTCSLCLSLLAREDVRERIDPATPPAAGDVQTIRVMVTVDTDELREWAGKHADAGHHGVAHVLYKAASDGESLTDQAIAQAKAEALREAADIHDGAAPAFASWLRDHAVRIEARP